MSQLPAPALPTFAPPDLKIYARLAWRWLWLVILCALLGGAAAYAVSLNMTPTYQASSKVMINEARTPSAANYNDILASERVARTYADLMTRPSVLEEAFVRLGLDPALGAGQISAVTVSPVRDTQLVALTIEGPNPQLAAAVANTLPAVFVDELRKIQVSRFSESKVSLTQQLDELSRQVETTKLQLAELEQQRTAQEEMEFTQLSGALTQYQTSYANLLQSYENLRLTEAQSTDTIVLIEPAGRAHGPRAAARAGQHAAGGRGRRAGSARPCLSARIPGRPRADARGLAAHCQPAGAGGDRVDAQWQERQGLQRSLAQACAARFGAPLHCRRGRGGG